MTSQGTPLEVSFEGYPVQYFSTDSQTPDERIFDFDLDLTIDSDTEWVLYCQRTANNITIRNTAVHWVEEW